MIYRPIAVCLALMLLGCSTSEYPDVSGMSPLAALAELDELERGVILAEQTVNQPRTTGPLNAQYSQVTTSFGNAYDPYYRQQIAEYRARLAADRERIYSANPSLRP